MRGQDKPVTIGSKVRQRARKLSGVKRAALELWGRRLQEIILGETVPTKVVELAERRK